MTMKAVWHIVKDPPSASAWQSCRHTICDVPVLGSAMLREESWSRSNSSWGMSQFKRPNDILAASSGFDQPSMIALASSRILEPGARLWKDCRPPRSYFMLARIKLPRAATCTAGDVVSSYFGLLRPAVTITTRFPPPRGPAS
jgi:hypothetical protein